MKKYAKIITSILLILLVSIALFACIDPDNDSQGTMTLVVLDGDNTKEYTVDLEKLSSTNGLLAVLDYLKANDSFTYESNDSGYGAFLTQVNDLREGNGSYIYLYTDVQDDMDVSQYATQITYKDKTCTNSNVGASQMSIKDGCTIIIALYSFN